jgi:hypothetical protein
MRHSGEVTAPTVRALSVPLAGYARRFHAAAGDTHHAGSPLGAWLLLALAGPACTGDGQAAVAEALGCDVATAAAAARDLLDDPHPLVGAAAALWFQDEPGQQDHPAAEAFTRWQDGLPASAASGPLPDQGGLDEWARQHSFGLIGSFPVTRTAQTMLVLATALATRVSWQQPFALAPARALGPASPWAARLNQVLRTPDGPDSGHQQFIAATRDAGDAVVHTAQAAGGLAVTSVAAEPDVPPEAVLAAAYELAMSLAAGQPPRQRSLFDLDLGERPLWSVTERPATAGGRNERCVAALPAWSARSSLDLTEPGLGFGAAIGGLAALAQVPGPGSVARQACAARFSRTGFEAAALSAVAVAAMARRPGGVLRVAELRFGHPYAVVATVTGSGKTGGQREAGSAWRGLPVFSAWVADPEDATDDTATGSS